jgi:hypothetical protein
MRLTARFSTRRTGLICLVVGFLAGIVATNIFSSLQVGHGEVNLERSTLMKHRQHNHDHNNDNNDDDATSETVSNEIDVPGTDALVHQGCVCVILHFCA